MQCIQGVCKVWLLYEEDARHCTTAHWCIVYVYMATTREIITILLASYYPSPPSLSLQRLGVVIHALLNALQVSRQAAERLLSHQVGSTDYHCYRPTRC